jgi:ABC-2 type transport system ATP-binding protein
MIEVRDVTKKFGKATVLDKASLCIEEKGIYCLLGRNGAGKTTLMKLISGISSCTKGEIWVDNKKVTTYDMPRSVNFIQGRIPGIHRGIRVNELLRISESLQDNFDRKFADKMAKCFELDVKKKYYQLSTGMKTMVSTILTLANNSNIILLDEPTLGLDAFMRRRFYQLLYNSYKLNPRIIIISTNLIPDALENPIDYLIIIHKGKFLPKKPLTLQDFEAKAYSLTGPSDLIEPLLVDLQCIHKSLSSGVTKAFIYDEKIEVPKGIGILALDLSLEEFFISIVAGENDDNFSNDAGDESVP